LHATAGASEPALDGSDRQAKLAGSLGVSQTLEIAENKTRSIAVGKPGDLGVDDPGVLVSLKNVLAVRTRHGRSGRCGTRLMLVTASSPPCIPGKQSDPQGDLVKPGGQRVAHSEPSCFLHEDEKGRLERVLGFVEIIDPGPTHAIDHRPMSPHQDGECHLRDVGCVLGV
jgi:hypothetical protein